MEPTGDKSGDLERRRSTRASVRVSVDHRDEDYDYDLALEGGTVADGFRPPQAGVPSSPPPPPSAPSLTSTSSTTLVSPGTANSTSSSIRSSSTAKPHGPRFSLLVRSESNALSRQTTGSTGSTVYFPEDGPYQGPSSASHPYHMYTQNVRPERTLSMTTSSTNPMSESSYRGPRGPSHPYGLYPQSDNIEPGLGRTDAIPLGFRGLQPDPYQRRVGPEGEEVGDMIGPDGHTEQLPPYTRYPDATYARKVAAADGAFEAATGATILPADVTPTSSPAPTIRGAGGLGLATRNPEFEPVDELDSPRSRLSTRSFRSDESMRGIRLDDEAVSEKNRPPKGWQLWMRKKACGAIPYWAMCLTGIVLLVLFVVLGAVIGTFLSNKSDPPPHRNPVWGPPDDTIPIFPPPDLPPLATGTFALPLMTSRVSNTCFEDPTLSQAWSCQLVVSGMQMSVSRHGDDYHAWLDSNRSYTLSEKVYAYGEQPPSIQKPLTLEVVQDRFESARGPAWFQKTLYNKTVVLPEDWLNLGDDDNSNSGAQQRRARHVTIVDGDIPSLARKGVAQPGEKPWICSWPNTYLELFIYPLQNSSFSNWPGSESASASSTAPDSTTTPPPPEHSTTGTEDEANSSPSGPPPGVYTPHDNTDLNDPDLKHKQFHTPQNYARRPNPTPAPHDDYDDKTKTSSTTASNTHTTTSTGTPANPLGPIDTGIPSAALSPPYPRVIKLAERRLPAPPPPPPPPPPRCTQVEIGAHGEKAKPVLGPDGMPLVVEIVESAPLGPPPPPAGPTTYGEGAAIDVKKRGLGHVDAGDIYGRDEGPNPGPTPDPNHGPGPDVSPCGCVWFLT
ncbi:uncharacterized protein C8A04DRAFT_9058 [Dichotomopilus funicola]|uniref:DUF7820 domain-containing protein n=1 Tax=Dichotomopilus funicola TaxID=1934379 RepID=A0AAN6V9X3_9PEZI|nr:hypothetical protein C8A04DRAFT_9058 [Dichotomopilus funicola]